MKVTVFGASGQVGSLLAQQHEKFGDDVCAVRLHHETSAGYEVTLDITDKSQVDRFFHSEWGDSDIFYLPAANTNVDDCEANSNSWEQNCLSVKNIVDAIVASQKNPLFVFYSSDFVFSGDAGPYDADTLPYPINQYGFQKLIAENYVAQHLFRYYIIRTHGVFGPDPQGKNFISRLLENLKAEIFVQIPIDEYGTPTYGPDLAANSISLATSNAPYGTYHIAGDAVVSRYHFAREAARIFNLDPRLIQGVYSSELKRKAVRPLNAGLISNYCPSLPWQEGLRAMKVLDDAQALLNLDWDNAP